MFRTIIIIVGLIMFVVLTPIYEKWGTQGAITTGVVLSCILGILIGFSRGAWSTKACFRVDEDLGCFGVIGVAIVSMIIGSFVANQTHQKGVGVVFDTFLLSAATLFLSAFIATYICWKIDNNK